MRQWAGRVGMGGVALACALGAGTVAAADPEDEGERRGGGPLARHLVTISIEAVSWDDLGKVTPVVPGFDPSRTGAFDDMGFGLEGSWYWRVRDGGAVAIGGEIGAWAHENEEDFVLVPQGSGFDLIEGADAGTGHLTGGVRWLLGDGRASGTLGLGLGYYSLRIDRFDDDDFDIDDDGYDAGGPGAYLSAGFRVGGPRFGVRVEGKVHWVALDDDGGIFQGQEPGGPVVAIGTGFEWRLGR